MDSYLANRPKMPASEHLETLDPSEGMAFRDPLDGAESFMSALPQTGGFQSLKSALLEAGSVLDAEEVSRANRQKEAAAGLEAHGHGAGHDHRLTEPTVELVTNNGRIEKVIVTCSCSRRIELDCTY
jgi:hypothetical protein